MAEHVLIVEAGVPVAGVQKTTICTFTIKGEEENEGLYPRISFLDSCPHNMPRSVSSTSDNGHYVNQTGGLSDFVIPCSPQKTQQGSVALVLLLSWPGSARDSAWEEPHARGLCLSSRVVPQGDRILIPCNDVDRRLENDLIIGS